MIGWIKNINKEYPEFWKKYLSKFSGKSNRYVILSTETTGLNPNKLIKFFVHFPNKLLPIHPTKKL